MKKIIAYILVPLIALTFSLSSFSQWQLTGNASTTPGTHFVGTTDNQHLVFKTNNTERARIFNNGNFLVGYTTDNGAKMQVNGTIYSTGLKLDPGNSIYWQDPGTHIQRNASSQLEFQEYTGQFVFQGSTNFILNLIHPTNGSASISFPSNQVFSLTHRFAAILQSSAPDEANCWIKVGANSAQYGAAPGVNLYLFGGPGGYVGAQNGGNVYIDGGDKGTGSTSASEGNILIATQRGKVGIGTTNPQAKLAVNGDILSKKVKVTQTGWADYVFDPSYDLPSLKEVENFIKQNRHLPDVPAAAEIEKNGLDLGDNQTVLLKKIEELTLYIIQQNNRIDKMEEEMQSLRKNRKQKK